MISHKNPMTRVHDLTHFNRLYVYRSVFAFLRGIGRAQKNFALLLSFLFEILDISVDTYISFFLSSDIYHHHLVTGI